MHIVHIGGSNFLTFEAFITISTLCQGQSYAAAARRWEELHLDYIRSGFARAKRLLPSTKMSQDARATMLRLCMLYEQLCAGVKEFHEAAEDLELMQPSVKAHGLQRVHAAAVYASAILMPTPTQDAAHDVGTSKCTGRRKNACPSPYTIAEAQKFAYALRYRELELCLQRLIRALADVGLCLGFDHTFRCALLNLSQIMHVCRIWNYILHCCMRSYTNYPRKI